MRESAYKNYNKAKVLGTSSSSGYELMYQPDLTVLRVSNCMTMSKHGETCSEQIAMKSLPL